MEIELTARKLLTHCQRRATEAKREAAEMRASPWPWPEEAPKLSREAAELMRARNVAEQAIARSYELRQPFNNARALIKCLALHEYRATHYSGGEARRAAHTLQRELDALEAMAHGDGTDR